MGLLKKNKEFLMYFIFGVLTTLVNYAVYVACHHAFSLNAALSNAIAWGVAVVFSYITNKPFVFKSNDWTIKTLVLEFSTFVASRVLSGALETGIMWLTVDFACWNSYLMKLCTSAIVMLLNYIAGKLLVFKKK